MSVAESEAGRRIRLLPEEIYNRIAAGEVVERPASVLKELIENALDAGAGHIEATVSGAGRREIIVTDDGAGMDREDLVLAFERHATSKVQSVEDLDAIRTLGFRGEALSAIASVSRMETVSRPRNSLSGHRLRLLGGKRETLEETGAPEGTTFAVRDLFFNTPARKKFLKSSGVENSHLVAVFKRYALAYPEIRWALTLDGRDLYRLPPETLESRLLAVFGEELNGRLFRVEAEAAGLRLEGYVGAPVLARKSRGDQHLFINRRWIQHRLLNHAVVTAYSKLLEAGLFPFYVLFLEVDPREVDVNVHPAKTEVKLRRENEVYGFVHQAAGDALHAAGLAVMGEMPLQAGERVDPVTGEITTSLPLRQEPATVPGRGYIPPYRPPESRPSPPEAYELIYGRSAAPPASREAPSPPPPAPAPAAVESPSGVERTQVYQMHRRYIVTEIKGGIAVIDQHAAHERVLYEKALKALTGGRLPSQQLLFPRIIELEVESAERLREVLDDLQALGIGIREFGERSFALEALPSGIPEAGDLVGAILDELKERGTLHRPGQEQVAAAFACRAAIKFGQTLTLPEMNGLIDQLFACRFPFTCPHGRPTLLQLTLGELERRFGR
ncbi:MAG: DNA mismatch repair endonuclease MutL [Candidatus Zixiibacteriota bacterium]|nr:MAG: DNA mismatch repair endonuclease MutL [candidate division Zixibacteria bacterium]